MSKPLWALTAIALIGGAGAVGAIVVASPGEEEVVQQLETAGVTTSASPKAVPSAASTVSATATPSPTPTSPSSTPAPCPQQPSELVTYVPPAANSKAYQDPESSYSLRYPGNWTVCSVQSDPQIRDLVSAIRFFDQSGLARASVYMYSNPRNLALEDWVAGHDPIFLDNPPEERTISGENALYSPTSGDGLPSPNAYLSTDGHVFGLSGLKDADFNSIAADFRLTQEG